MSTKSPSTDTQRGQRRYRCGHDPNRFDNEHDVCVACSDDCLDETRTCEDCGGTLCIYCAEPE